MEEREEWRRHNLQVADEVKRIKRIVSPAERARQYAWLDQWDKQERETIRMLLLLDESRTSERYEERNYD